MHSLPAGRLSNVVSMASGFSAARLLGDNYYSSGLAMDTGVASFWDLIHHRLLVDSMHVHVCLSWDMHVHVCTHACYDKPCGWMLNGFISAVVVQCNPRSTAPTFCVFFSLTHSILLPSLSLPTSLSAIPVSTVL